MQKDVRWDLRAGTGMRRDRQYVQRYITRARPGKFAYGSSVEAAAVSLPQTECTAHLYISCKRFQLIDITALLRRHSTQLKYCYNAAVTAAY